MHVRLTQPLVAQAVKNHMGRSRRKIWSILNSAAGYCWSVAARPRQVCLQPGGETTIWRIWRVHVRRWDVKERRAKTPKQTNRLVYNNHVHKLEQMFNSGLPQNAARVNDCCTELTPCKQVLHGAQTKSSGHAKPVTARFPTLK